jgi:molybdopterin-guanine dinucleotide biosynthesis protein A
VSHWTTIVLSGGASTRMGQDKATIDLAGKSLLDRTIEGIPDDVPIIVSGPVVTLERDGVRFVREDPPGGGPVAGVDAALGLVQTPVVVVLAADLPFAGTAPEQLAAALLSADNHGDDDVDSSDDRSDDDDDDDERLPLDGLMWADADGRHQMLCAAYRTPALRDAIAANGSPHGASMRSVVARLNCTTVMVMSIDDGPSESHNRQPGASWDLDTPEDLAAARAMFTHDDDDDDDSENDHTNENINDNGRES